jgi:hypothetical protein
MKVVLLAFAIAACVAAQPIGFGLKLGAPLTDAVNLATGSGTLANTATRFTIGPMVDLRLPFGVGIEADLLYRRVGADYTFSNTFSAGVHGNQWDVPVLLKYRFPFPIVKPYLEAGPSFRWFTNVNHSFACLPTCTPPGPAQISTNSSGAGLTFGGGVEVRLLFIRIAPELRYTRWGSEAFSVGQSDGTTLFHASQNQAEFLVGIHF